MKETHEQLEARLKSEYAARQRIQMREISAVDYESIKANMLATSRETLRGKSEQGESVDARELTEKQYAAHKAAYLRSARR